MFPNHQLPHLGVRNSNFKAPLTGFMGSAIKREVLSKYVLPSSFHSVIPTEVPSCHAQTIDSQVMHICCFGSVPLSFTLPPHYFAPFLFTSFTLVYAGMYPHSSYFALFSYI